MEWISRTEQSPIATHQRIEETGAHTQRVRNLRAIYREAGVMLELADYAERNGDPSETAMVKALRSDAVQIRIGVVKTLVMRSYPWWTPSQKTARPFQT